MAVTGSTEFDVNATPEQVMDAVAAIEDLPQRSSAHQSAEVETRYDDGRPKRVRAKVSAAGLSDTEVTDYIWDGLRLGDLDARGERGPVRAGRHLHADPDATAAPTSSSTSRSA